MIRILYESKYYEHNRSNDDIIEIIVDNKCVKNYLNLSAMDQHKLLPCLLLFLISVIYLLKPLISVEIISLLLSPITL